jgi:hypothetical protein
MKKSILISLLIVCLLINQTESGPVLGGLCYAGCAAVVVACYSAAGFTFGTIAAAAAPPAIIACNAAFGKCMAACSAAFGLPTP